MSDAFTPTEIEQAERAVRQAHAERLGVDKEDLHPIWVRERAIALLCTRRARDARRRDHKARRPPCLEGARVNAKRLRSLVGAADLKARIGEYLKQRDRYDSNRTVIERHIKEQIEKVLGANFKKDIDEAVANMRKQLDAAVSSKFTDAIKAAMGVR